VVSVEILLKPTQMREVGELHELARCAPVVQLKKGILNRPVVGAALINSNCRRL